MKEVQILDKTFTVMIDETTIVNRIKSISAQLTEEYAGKNPIFIGVLNGAFLFLADLFKGINTPCELSFIRVTSYSGTKSTGEMKNVFGLKDRACLFQYRQLRAGSGRCRRCQPDPGARRRHPRRGAAHQELADKDSAAHQAAAFALRLRADRNAAREPHRRTLFDCPIP